MAAFSAWMEVLAYFASGKFHVTLHEFYLFQYVNRYCVDVMILFDHGQICLFVLYCSL